MNFELTYTRIKKVAIEHPDAAAIIDGQNITSYHDLVADIDALQDFLVQQEVLPGEIVAVIGEPGREFITAAISALASGYIYMPIDLRFPTSLLERIWSEYSPRIVLTTKASLENLVSLVNKHIINPSIVVNLGTTPAYDLYKVKEGAMVLLRQTNEQVSTRKSRDCVNGSYIFFSSGTTGTPKAIHGDLVAISHFVNWEIRQFGLMGRNLKFSFLTQITFDASLRDIFTPLCSGGTICIPGLTLKNDAAKLLHWLIKEQIDFVHSVPSFIRTLSAYENSTSPLEGNFRLKYLLVAGEVLYYKDVINWKQLFGDQLTVVNLYGTSESTMIKSFHVVDPEQIPDLIDVVHCGQPIDDSFILIVDNGRLCKINELGEVLIKSPYLTKGYYKNEALTKRNFIQNPLISDKTDIVNRTGDIGKYLSDRSVLIVGRRDDQVKVNGIRIELSEINSIVRSIPSVQESVVIIHENANGVKDIICYYMGGNDLEQAIRDKVTSQLGDEARPGFVIKIESFPMTLNGKVDKKRLPVPAEVLFANMVYRKLDQKLEFKIGDIWNEILGFVVPGKDISFFSIGGSSLKGIRLISMLARTFEVDIRFADLVENDTIEEQAAILQKLQKDKNELVDQGVPSLLRSEMSFHHQYVMRIAGTPVFKRIFISRIDIIIHSKVEIIELKTHLHNTFGRHAILRWSELLIRDLSANKRKLNDLMLIVEAEVDTESQNDHVHPLRLLIGRMEDDSLFLSFIFNQGVIDRLGVEILLGELVGSYRQIVLQPSGIIPDDEHIRYENKCLTQVSLEVINRQQERLRRFIEPQVTPSREISHPMVINVSVNENDLIAFERQATTNQTTLHNWLLTIFYFWLRAVFSKTTFHVGVSFSNRSGGDFGQSIGTFNNYHLVQMDFEELEDFKAANKIISRLVNDERVSNVPYYYLALQNALDERLLIPGIVYNFRDISTVAPQGEISVDISDITFLQQKPGQSAFEVAMYVTKRDTSLTVDLHLSPSLENLMPRMAADLSIKNFLSGLLVG